MTVFNGVAYLKEAIDSILQQTFEDFEFLIIDDTSTDGSCDLIESYNDPRIRLVKNKNNIGQTRSLNHGLELGVGKYAARIDQDDISLQDRLAKQVDFLDNNPKVALLGTWFELISANGSTIKTVTRPTRHEDIVDMITLNNPFAHPSVMYRRNAAIKVGGYPEKFSYAQDRVLWLYISRGHRVANLPEVLTQVRCHEAQATQSPEFNIIRKREFVEIMRIASKNTGISPSIRKDCRTKIVKGLIFYAQALESEGYRCSAWQQRLEGYLLYPDVWFRKLIRKTKRKF